MRRMIAVALLAVVVAADAALAADDKVMKQPDSPIQITVFASEFGGRDNDYIIFEARYQNASSRSVIGIKFGFIAYDLFNESLGGVNGVAINRNGVGAGDVDSKPMAETGARGCVGTRDRNRLRAEGPVR